MKLIKMKCSNCGGFTEFQIQNGQKQAFCPYCGQKYLVDDEKLYVEINHKITHNINHNININKTKIKRKIDDAAIVRAQNEERIYKARSKYEEAKAEKLMISIGFSVIGLLAVVLCVICILHVVKDAVEVANREGVYVSPISSSSDYWRDNYVEVVGELKSAGFKNITTVDLDDASWLNKENTVSKVTINGDSEFYTDEEFPEDAEVVVYYH